MSISLLNTATAIQDAFLTDGVTIGAPWETSQGASAQDASESAAAGAEAGIAAEEQAVLADLLQSNGSDPSLLAQLTNVPYSTSNPPDVLQISAGSDVTPDFAGGYTSVGWVMDGAEVTMFSTGQPPNAVKGFAITYAQDAPTATRQTALKMAQSYLSDHLSDAQDGAGQWNQPTFDVSV